jgi:hypothetical protein
MATAEVSLSGAKNSSGVSAHGVVRPESGWQETASIAREAASRARCTELDLLHTNQKLPLM